MTLTIPEKEIREFQKNLTAHIQSIMAANNKEIKESIYNNDLKSLNEKTNENLIAIKQNGEALHVSYHKQKYFLETMGEHNDIG